MRRRRTFGLAAAGAAAALMLAACSSGGGNGNGNGSNSSSSAAYGAGITSVVNSSTRKGGTLTFDWRSAPDSFDPGNTYFAADWDFARLLTGPDDL
jgi:peptide/nickel transport system substrate-binding protein